MPNPIYTETVKRPASYWKPEKYKDTYLTIKEVGVKLKKDPSWLRKLERRGIIPRPSTVKRGKLHIRLYSPEQVKEIEKILKTIKPGRKRKEVQD